MMSDLVLGMVLSVCTKLLLLLLLLLF
jgi:hypothetical protein